MSLHSLCYDMITTRRLSEINNHRRCGIPNYKGDTYTCLYIKHVLRRPTEFFAFFGVRIRVSALKKAYRTPKCASTNRKTRNKHLAPEYNIISHALCTAWNCSHERLPAVSWAVLWRWLRRPKHEADQSSTVINGNFCVLCWWHD
jgi:hypothetical protein